MDRIIKITLGVFIIILVSFTGYCLYTSYVENAYRNSLESTYTYSFAFSTDAPLYNVTLFLPVPTTPGGSSPAVRQFSSQAFAAIPDTWTTTLYGSGKTTLLKVTAPSIIPPAETNPENPYIVVLAATYPVKGPIDTLDPVKNSAVFRPVQNLNAAACRADSPAGATCYTYSTSFYADYTTRPDANVRFASSMAGKNTWNIFGPESNEYSTSVSILLFGENHGWTSAQGFLAQGSGSYNTPVLPS